MRGVSNGERRLSQIIRNHWFWYFMLRPIDTSTVKTRSFSACKRKRKKSTIFQAVSWILVEKTWKPERSGEKNWKRLNRKLNGVSDEALIWCHVIFLLCHSKFHRFTRIAFHIRRHTCRTCTTYKAAGHFPFEFNYSSVVIEVLLFTNIAAFIIWLAQKKFPVHVFFCFDVNAQRRCRWQQRMSDFVRVCCWGRCTIYLLRGCVQVRMFTQRRPSFPYVDLIKDIKILVSPHYTRLHASSRVKSFNFAHRRKSQMKLYRMLILCCEYEDDDGDDEMESRSFVESSARMFTQMTWH